VSEYAMIEKPFAQHCEQNKEPILEVLKDVFADCSHVLEIGSGTGQHAVHFGCYLPHLVWQTADLPERHEGILAWMEDAALPNVRPPLPLNAEDEHWPVASVDGIFSANTVHIMSWSQVEGMFRGIGRVLETGGRFALYGPFNYGGAYTSPSNARFDAWLKERDPASGIRDFEALDTLAREQGMELLADFEMPVNNRILVWVKG
jgi:SAM-dependent methyltransferase